MSNLFQSQIIAIKIKTFTNKQYLNKANDQGLQRMNNTGILLAIQYQHHDTKNLPSSISKYEQLMSGLVFG
jgi:hypothetical protein